MIMTKFVKQVPYFGNSTYNCFVAAFASIHIGPLNNMKESMIQFSKPRKLVNKTNPVSSLSA